MATIHSFDVELEEAWEGDDITGNYAYDAVVKLAGVELYRRPVSGRGRGAPTWEEETKEEALYHFALKLKRLLSA